MQLRQANICILLEKSVKQLIYNKSSVNNLLDLVTLIHKLTRLDQTNFQTQLTTSSSITQPQ